MLVVDDLAQRSHRSLRTACSSIDRKDEKAVNHRQLRSRQSCHTPPRSREADDKPRREPPSTIATTFMQASSDFSVCGQVALGSSTHKTPCLPPEQPVTCSSHAGRTPQEDHEHSWEVSQVAICVLSEFLSDPGEVRFARSIPSIAQTSEASVRRHRSGFARSLARQALNDRRGCSTLAGTQCSALAYLRVIIPS